MERIETNDYVKNLWVLKLKKNNSFRSKIPFFIVFFIIQEYFDTDFAINDKSNSTKGKPKSFSIQVCGCMGITVES